MRKMLYLFSLALLLVANFLPSSLVLADNGSDKVNVKASDELAAIKPGTPITIFFNDNGEITKVKEGFLDGSKCEILKDSIPVIESTGMHNRSFDLWNTNRSWKDTGHPAHYLNVGDRQAIWSGWTPDGTTPCFAGVYFVDGNYAKGITTTSPNNVLFVAGTKGYYRPYVYYTGSRQYSSPCHFIVNYQPWF